MSLFDWYVFDLIEFISFGRFIVVKISFFTGKLEILKILNCLKIFLNLILPY